MKSVFLFCRQYLSTLCYSVNPGYNTGIYAVALLLIFLFNIVAKCWKFYFCCCSVIACLSFCHRLQHARLPWPSLSPRVCSNSCPFSWWYYLTMPSSTTLLSFFLSFPESRSFPVSQIFESHGQSVVALFNINLSNEYSAIISFRIDWFDFLAVQESLQHHNSKASTLRHSGFFMAHLSHHAQLLEKS